MGLLLALPGEILVDILGRLDPSSLIKTVCLSRRLYGLTGHTWLWRRLFASLVWLRTQKRGKPWCEADDTCRRLARVISLADDGVLCYERLPALSLAIVYGTPAHLTLLLRHAFGEL